MCPANERSCLDGSKCVNYHSICNNKIDCRDGSDEFFCTCKNRINIIRKCDGFSDCPNAEDEEGCFGCSEKEFNCDDWSRYRRSTCIPLEQRCDNIEQCPITGKDEEDCWILTDHIGRQPQWQISNALGFLHRNYKGVWYPTCYSVELLAKKICTIENGQTPIAPKFYMMMMSNRYNGNFINILPNNKVEILRTCIQNHVVFVECPLLDCGLRTTLKNIYRIQEVQTSAEELNDIPKYIQLPHKTISHVNESGNVLNAARIVGGKPSQPAAWPWLLSIYKNGVFHCGGILINEIWALTAAHCVDRYWNYYFEIEAGTVRRFSYSPMQQIRSVLIIIPHTKYNKNIFKNDIALLKLATPVRYNRYVRPICLPSETTAGHDFLRQPLPGSLCTTVGWGATTEHGSYLDHMREIVVPILNHCGDFNNPDEHLICAGLIEGGKDACQGDSGGPLMCRNLNNPSQWYLAGIISQGEGCARPNQPGVYTKVSKYIGWITKNISNETIVSRTPLKKCPGYVCKGTKKCLPWKRQCDKVIDCLMGDDEMKCDNLYGYK